jgi:hypothetical protein
MINHERTKNLVYIFVLIAITFGIGFFLSKPDLDASVPSEKNSALNTAINDCDEITERAAAHLKAVVEFQKLEIIGRKARVFKQCMRDHGYMENKQWLDFIMPYAQKEASTSNISIDEALENIRRGDMKVAQTESPPYWIKRVTK